MKKETALKIILWIALAGILFSGYLSYNELTTGFCPIGSCPSIATIPACVYGLVMYLTVFVIAFLGLKSSK